MYPYLYLNIHIYICIYIYIDIYLSISIFYIYILYLYIYILVISGHTINQSPEGKGKCSAKNTGNNVLIRKNVRHVRDFSLCRCVLHPLWCLACASVLLRWACMNSLALSSTWGHINTLTAFDCHI
jgi:hypothetical protein